MALDSKQCQITRAKFIRALAGTGIASVGIGSVGGGVATATKSREETETQTIVDFDWDYPRCPDQEVSTLDQYFFGDLASSGGFHLDDGGGAEESPDGCVLRTDADGVVANSLPDGHTAQSDTLEHYPRRGETIQFEHYVHREGATMEFRFGVQEEMEDHYALRFETDTDESPNLYLLRSDRGEPTILDQVSDISYSDQQFHDFVIEWFDDEITTSLLQNGSPTTLSADDATYDQGGIAFSREGAGTLFAQTHLWNNVEAIVESNIGGKIDE